MKIYRIWAMFLRYLYSFTDLDRITEFFLWPAVDIGIYGLIARWVGEGGMGEAHLASLFITGLIFWQVTYRAHFEICFNVYDEYAEHNLTNLIATPLTRSEWSASLMVSGFLKTFITFAFGSLVGYFLFSVNVWTLGWAIVPYIILCILSGWIMGFIGAGILIYHGPRFYQLPWIVITLAGIFSAITYPLSVLPNWMQNIALCLPMAYIFEGMRRIMIEGAVSWQYLLFSFILNFVYLVMSLAFFFWMFERSRNKGFQH